MELTDADKWARWARGQAGRILARILGAGTTTRPTVDPTEVTRFLEVLGAFWGLVLGAASRAKMPAQLRPYRVTEQVELLNFFTSLVDTITAFADPDKPNPRLASAFNEHVEKIRTLAIYTLVTTSGLDEPPEGIHVETQLPSPGGEKP